MFWSANFVKYSYNIGLKTYVYLNYIALYIGDFNNRLHHGSFSNIQNSLVQPQNLLNFKSFGLCHSFPDPPPLVIKQPLITFIPSISHELSMVLDNCILYFQTFITCSYIQIFRFPETSNIPHLGHRNCSESSWTQIPQRD